MLAITGGGTGGHLCIARSLAQELKKQGARTHLYWEHLRTGQGMV
ncbi:hypothetical protein HBZS_110390 [Helicobacter bizzozeronii CCUG 35545]|nr:hypothetical protein HBZS_110390 [Helicobacter bizzozeronii CCUG 35545]